MQYKRVLIKISGEALLDESDHSILSHDALILIANQIKSLAKSGVQIGLVIGAGNIFRGKFADKIGVERSRADYMGMLGTIINAVAFESILNDIGVPSVVMSSIEVKAVCEPYISKRAIHHLNKGRTVIFAGGTGNPFFTTDTTAALRAMELNMDAILMAKNGVDGVYNCDPTKYDDAIFIPALTYQDLMEKNLKVMDQTAASLLLNNKDIVVHVFDIDKKDAIIRIVKGEKIGTIIKREL